MFIYHIMAAVRGVLQAAFGDLLVGTSSGKARCGGFNRAVDDDLIQVGPERQQGVVWGFNRAGGDDLIQRARSDSKDGAGL